MPGRNANPGLYRYGFQNQETDPEMLGGAVAFKYRVHDPRIGRFLSIDPLSATYPWNSPYAFSENRVISAIELEGLEAVDVNTNQNINEPYSSQEKLDETKRNGDIAPWNDLINFKPNNEDVKKADERVLGTPKVQTIEGGNGQLNTDYYSVVISKLPNGVSTPEELLTYFRLNLNSFTNDNTNFEEYAVGEGALFRANINSALMTFEVLLGVSWLSVDDLSVMQSKNSTNYWVFSTMTTLRDGGHPVSGNRQFGITTNANGTYTFFTRGADRPNTLLDMAVSTTIFKGADALWQAVMTKMVEHVNTNGGEAKRNATFSKQTDYK